MPFFVFIFSDLYQTTYEIVTTFIRGVLFCVFFFLHSKDNDIKVICMQGDEWSLSMHKPPTQTVTWYFMSPMFYICNRAWWYICKSQVRGLRFIYLFHDIDAICEHLNDEVKRTLQWYWTTIFTKWNMKYNTMNECVYEKDHKAVKTIIRVW